MSQSEEVGFDLRVQIRDPKTGAVIRTQPYVLHDINDQEVFERPVGSGNVFWKSGEAAGRVEVDELGKTKFVKEAQHKAWSAPETEDDRLRKEVLSTREKNLKLEREIEAIRRERKYGTPAPGEVAKKTSEAR